MVGQVNRLLMRLLLPGFAVLPERGCRDGNAFGDQSVVEQLPMKERDSGIDVLRGLSILAVAIYHYGYFDYGFYGVLLFFMISGYCMTPSVVSSRTAWHFLLKRWKRLLPALIVCAVMTYLVKYYVPLEGRGVTLGDIGKMLLCMPLADLPCRVMKWGYVPPDWAYWSLIVEFKFYAVLAFAYFFVSRRHFFYVFAALTALGLIGMLFFSKKPLGSEFLSYLPYFLAGMALFQWQFGDKRAASVGIGVAIVTYVGFQVFVRSISIPPNWITLGAFLTCIGLILAAVRWVPDVRGAVAVRVFLFFGMISYPLYLLHQDISTAAFSLISRDIWAKVVVGSVVVAMAYLISRHIENRWRSVRTPATP